MALDANTLDGAALRLDGSVRQLLGSLRRRIRAYVWCEGLGGWIAAAGCAFWASLAIDWFFEPPVVVRAALLAAIVAGLAWVLWRRLVGRLRMPLPDRSMALVLERHFPKLGDSLLTAVELVGESSPDDYNRCLLEETCRTAARRSHELHLGEVFHVRPLRRSVAAAALLIVSVVLFGVMAPKALGVWFDRAVLLSDALWPRQTHLIVEGFDESRVAKVARGANFDLRVKAEMIGEGEAQHRVAPQLVEVHSRTDGGARDRKPMDRDGVADVARGDRYQRYSYSFRAMLASLVFDVAGGDDRVSNLRLEVVDNPAIVAMSARCEFPRYMDRPPQTLPFAGALQFPTGSRVTLEATTNKDLQRVAVELSGGNGAEGRAALPAAVDADDPKQFSCVVEKLDKDKTLLFTLLDTDGIRSSQPIRVNLSALEDRRPEFAAQLRGIGMAITPQASIPPTGKVNDDHGLARVWFEYAVDQAAPSSAAIAAPQGNVTELPLSQPLDVRPLGLKPGQKFQLCMKASDRCDLPGGPNVGTSDRWQLDVVTPEKLRIMLQARELVLRQRFEAMIKDAEETRENIARVDFTPPKPAAPAADKAPAKPASAPGAKPSGKAAEPGDKPAVEGEDTPVRLAAKRLVHVQWAMQNSIKTAHEIAGLADAFASIREELINNRIDTEEWKRRLEQGITAPLRRIGDEMFPELDRRLERLQTLVADPQQGPEVQVRAVQQADAVLAAMRQVLTQMLEMEDFNEAVELLRSIIDAQEGVNSQTKQRQKQKLRELME